MDAPLLLTDEQLTSINDRCTQARQAPWAGTPPDFLEMAESLLSHIAALNLQLTAAVEKLDDANTEITRLCGVPDSLFRYGPDYSDQLMYEYDTGEYLKYDEVLAAMASQCDPT